jgi:hypothetical protein
VTDVPAATPAAPAATTTDAPAAVTTTAAPAATPAPDPKPFTPIESQEDLDKLIGRRIYEERAKFANYDELKAAADELAEIRKAGETDLERVTGERDTFKTSADTLTAENARLKVALEKKLPADLIDRLRGNTVEELSADADKLLELVKPAVPPVPGFDGGARTPAPTPGIDDQIADAESKGDVKTSTRLKLQKLAEQQAQQ